MQFGVRDLGFAAYLVAKKSLELKSVRQVKGRIYFIFEGKQDVYETEFCNYHSKTPESAVPAATLIASFLALRSLMLSLKDEDGEVYAKPSGSASSEDLFA